MKEKILLGKILRSEKCKKCLQDIEEIECLYSKDMKDFRDLLTRAEGTNVEVTQDLFHTAHDVIECLGIIHSKISVIESLVGDFYAEQLAVKYGERGKKGDVQ